MTQKKQKTKQNKETDDPSCMKNLQVYQLMRLITMTLPAHHGSQGDLYRFKRESFSERASNPLGETFERCTGIFNSRQVSHGNVHY